MGQEGTLTRPNQRRAGRVAAGSVPDAAVAAAAAGRRPPPLCLDSIDHVTLSHETRICWLPPEGGATDCSAPSLS